MAGDRVGCHRNARIRGYAAWEEVMAGGGSFRPAEGIAQLIGLD